jgi:hypothetical protein
MTENLQKKTFRFQFNAEIIDMLLYFSKLHQYDTRHDYKDAWKIWFEDNNDILLKEQSRLIDLGYTGDVEDKMYKASRYYFRNKRVNNSIKSNNTKGKSEDVREDVDVIIKGLDKLDVGLKPKKRQYVLLGHEMLDVMDTHIKKNIDNANYSPAKGFDDFYKNNKELLERKILSLKNNDLDDDYISSKIKKTYKNRYYNYSKK